MKQQVSSCPHKTSQNNNYKITATMESIIKLTGINKIYRTDEVETQALENINIEVEKG